MVDKLMGKVSKCVRYDYTSTGGGNYNGIHDKPLYEVEHPDVITYQLSADIIAENIMSQVDSESHHYQLITEVTDQKKGDSAISKVGVFIKSISGNLQLKRTTCGWRILVEWKYGSVYWVPLNYLKQSNPVDLD